MGDEQVQIWGWDEANTKPVKVLVDNLGHLQVDTLTSALPTGAATYGMQNLGNQYLDLIRLLLTDRLPAALDTLALKVREQGTPQQNCYGWDGDTWEKMLFESTTLHNLRVRLYAGANPIAVRQFAATGIFDADYGLAVNAGLRISQSATGEWLEVRSLSSQGDGITAYYMQGAGLFGFNGSKWDRLRSYGTGILKVGRAEVGLLDVRLTATGQVGAAGARKLFWLICNPSAGNSVFELSDDTDGSTATVMDCFSTAREGKGFNFDPPLEFANGIYLKTFTNMTSCVFGYL